VAVIRWLLNVPLNRFLTDLQDADSRKEDLF
jgi:hypothetical protein